VGSSPFVFFGPLPPANTAAEVVKHREDVATLPSARAAMDVLLVMLILHCVEYEDVQGGCIEM